MKDIIIFLINPPIIIAILFFFAIISSKPRNKIKIYFYSLSFFIFSSIPFTYFILSYPLVNFVEVSNSQNLKKFKSVIVLTAGIRKNVLGIWKPSISSENRALLGKKISETLSIPLIISGGVSTSETVAESVIIKNHFNLKNTLIEQNSSNTNHSAKNLSSYCKNQIGPFLLVTGKYQRLRSFLTFRSNHCNVFLVENKNEIRLESFIPSTHSMSLFRIVFYEYAGIFYYILSQKIKPLILFKS